MNLLTKVILEYYETLDLNKIIDNKNVWKTMKPFFSEKCRSNKIINLINEENVITNETKIAETMKNYQTSISANASLDKITYAITKFKDPRIFKMKKMYRLPTSCLVPWSIKSKLLL